LKASLRTLGKRTWLEFSLPNEEAKLKSNVSDYLELVDCVYKDATAKCPADVSDLRDLKTIRSRVEDEGLSFLTITLPKFANDLLRGLEQGFVDSDLFPRWMRQKGSVMPAFLQGITSHIFNFETGKVLYDEISPSNGGSPSDFSYYVDAVRQICLTLNKLKKGCTPKREASALENFTEIENSLSTFSLPAEEHAKFLAASSLLWGNMFTDFQCTDCIPVHGPGTTAERITGNGKFSWRRWHDRLEPYFPLIDNGYPIGTPIDSEELKMVTIVPEHLESPVRVVTVPKTLKAPRIIAIEPVCMQYVQHGIQDWLYRRLESHWMSSGHVNFTDQKINQRLAMIGSETGQFATIDLSDASDRVPRDLAMEMFRSNRDLFDSIDACRSTSAKLPSGQIIAPLKKFASMGSALCFPVEAMYFYTICVVALLDCNDLSYTFENAYRVSRDVYVYGDDIIVPTAYAGVVLDYLQKYNCKVNFNKTFYSGKFRESCGVEAFAGIEVTPIYVRQEPPENKHQASSIISWIATANLFYKKGMWRTTQFMRNKCERLIGPLPYLPESTEGIGHISFLGRNVRSIGRWNPFLHRFEVRTMVPKPVRRTDVLNGYGALTKAFQGLEGRLTSSFEGSHLRRRAISDPVLERSFEHSVLRGEVALKRRWVATS
jgi:hypothetical protein